MPTRDGNVRMRCNDHVREQWLFSLRIAVLAECEHVDSINRELHSNFIVGLIAGPSGAGIALQTWDPEGSRLAGN